MTELADRVQRIVTGDVPVLHIEPEIPTGRWDVHIDGAVAEPAVMTMDEVHALPAADESIDLHCVWGWSRPDIAWTGTTLDALTAQARPAADATHVVITAKDSPYASCFTVPEAAAGRFAWVMDGEPLPAERGGPLRFVPPATKWAYKGVKWVERITFTMSFTPGFWEEAVGDPRGDIPPDVLEELRTR